MNKKSISNNNKKSIKGAPSQALQSSKLNQNNLSKLMGSRVNNMFSAKQSVKSRNSQKSDKNKQNANNMNAVSLNASSAAFSDISDTRSVGGSTTRTKKKKKKNKSRIQRKKSDLETTNPEFQEWREMLKHEVDMCPLGCFLVNKDSEIVHCNYKGAVLFHQDVFDLINNDINMLVPPEIRKIHNNLVDTQFKSATDRQQERELHGYSKEDKAIKVSLGLLMRKLPQGENINLLTMAQVVPLNDDQESIVIMPTNPFQVIWIIFMCLSIAQPIMLVPQQAVFSNSEDNLSVNIFIYITALFDIILNFNFAQVEGEKIITDRESIFHNQLSSQFLIDFQTAFPVEIITWLLPGLNPVQLMSFKLLRSLKLLKQQRILTDTQMLELLTKRYELFKDFRQLSNKYLQVQEISGMLFILLGMLHQLTSFFVLIELVSNNPDNWLYNSGIFTDEFISFKYVSNQRYVQDVTTDDQIKQNDFIKTTRIDPQAQINNHPFKSQIISLQEIASIFLRFKTINQPTNFEFWYTTFLGFMGLIQLAQVIGRISELITELNKENQLQYRINSLLQSIMGEAKISGRIIAILLTEIKKNSHAFEQFNNMKVLKKGLSDNLYHQLQIEYYHEFMERHKLLRLIPVQFIEYLQRQTKVVKSNVLQEINDLPTKLFFITKGEVRLKSANDKVVFNQEDNEVVGFKEFQQQISKTKNIGDIKDERGNTLKRSEAHNMQNQQRQRAVAEPKTIVFSIMFQLLEDMFNNDKELMRMIENYVIFDHLNIPKVDHNYTLSEIESFESYPENGIMFLPDGVLYKVNKEFRKLFNVDEIQLKGQNFQEIIREINGITMVKDMFKAPAGRYTMKMMGQNLECEISFSYKHIVVKKERIVYGQVEMVELKREVCVLQCKVINFIDAYVLGQQRAVKVIDKVEAVNINNHGEDIDSVEENKNMELDFIVLEMQDLDMKVDDIKLELKHEKEEKLKEFKENRLNALMNKSAYPANKRQGSASPGPGKVGMVSKETGKSQNRNSSVQPGVKKTNELKLKNQKHFALNKNESNFGIEISQENSKSSFIKSTHK